MWSFFWFCFSKGWLVFPFTLNQHSNHNLICVPSRVNDTCCTSKFHKLRKLWRHNFFSFSYFIFKMSTYIYQSLFYQNTRFGTYIPKTMRPLSHSRETGHICYCSCLWYNCNVYNRQRSLIFSNFYVDWAMNFILRNFRFWTWDVTSDH